MALRATAPDPATFTGFGLDRFASGVLLKSDMPAAMMEPLLMSNPAEAALLAEEVSRRIEGELEYPGQIKIMVIRETRATAIAK